MPTGIAISFKTSFSLYNAIPTPDYPGLLNEAPSKFNL